MKGLMLFNDYFEDVEGIAVVDVLNRANIELEKVSLNDYVVKTAHGNKMIFDKTINEIDYRNYDFLIIPGGPAVFRYLHNNPLVDEIVKYYCDNNKLVCAICAAPSLIGKHGYFKDLKYACFPGCEGPVVAGTKSSNPIEVSNNFITARSMYYANDFALEIVKKIKGIETYQHIRDSIKGLYK